MKVDKATKTETRFIALGHVILSVIMESVFLIIGRYDYTVTTGNILGSGVSVLSFFLMCLSIQKAVLMNEEDAQKKMKSSQGGRYILIIVVMIIGASLPYFNIFAMLIPLLFTRILVVVRNAMLNKQEAKAAEKEGEEIDR